MSHSDQHPQRIQQSRKRKAEDLNKKKEKEGLPAHLAELLGGAADDYFERVKKFAQEPRKCFHNHFQGVPIIDAFHDNKSDWMDKELKDLKIFRLQKLTHEEIVALGKKTFSAILSGGSKIAAANLMILAYNLMDDNGSRLIHEYERSIVDMGNIFDPIEADDRCFKISEDKRSGSKQKTLRRAIGYTYLAASYLRLFAKSAENYQKIGASLRENFRNFYSFDFPFDEFHPELEVIKSIKNQFENHLRFKDTLYVFLYASCENTQGENLKSFLYKIHLNYTGLQPYVLFLKCMESLDINEKDLSELLSTPMFKRQLRGIGDLISLDRKKAGYSLKLWKFARIFDPKFMSVLQTKKCVTFVLVLGFIVSETGRTDNDGPLQIACVRDASASARREAHAIALHVIKLAKRAT